MDFDLRRASWIPWRRRRSGVVWGPIATLVDGLDGDDPIIATAAPRPDFDGALLEFLIGVLSVALHADDDDAWRLIWNKPPSPAELQVALDALPDAFILDAEHGPRFLQDFSPIDLVENDVLSIDRLAMDSPGEQGVKLNKTLFVKPARFTQISRPAAAMALITMQTYAPAGGQGNRTSMRGGGPLTTLADPRRPGTNCHADEQPLWELLWFNAETEEQSRGRAQSGGASTPANIFPWLAPTLTSDNKKPPVTPARAHAWQAYFGMPRRISLVFGVAGRCDLTGREDERLVTGYRMRNFGVEYSGWKHPLSPHYDSKNTEWLPVHPQPGGLSWKDWPDMALLRPGGANEPAACIPAALRRAYGLGIRNVRLRAFGYDMDKMKARAWVTAVQPLVVVSPAAIDVLESLGLLASKLVEATSLASAALKYAIKAAWFQRPDDAGADPLVQRQKLWAQTEARFFAALNTASQSGWMIDGVQQERRNFLEPLRDITMALLEEAAPVASAQVTAVRRRVSARHALSGTFRGFGKLGAELYGALSLDAPKVDSGSRKLATRKRGAGK